MNSLQWKKVSLTSSAEMWAWGCNSVKRKSSGCCISGCEVRCCSPMSEPAGCCPQHLCWPSRLRCGSTSHGCELCCCDREGFYVINKEKQSSINGKSKWKFMLTFEQSAHHTSVFLQLENKKPDYLQDIKRGNYTVLFGQSSFTVWSCRQCHGATREKKTFPVLSLFCDDTTTLSLFLKHHPLCRSTLK